MEVQQLFTNLKKEAECPLCLETVNNPKTLPCLHSFCLKCLDKLAGFARRQLQTTIKCPVCQTSLQIPEGDSFKNLPTSFHLNRLVDLLALKDGSAQTQKCGSCDEKDSASCYCFVCQNFLCAACFEDHQRLKATRGHHNVSIDKLEAQDVQEFIHRPVMCSQQYHKNQPLEFYCEECKVLICHKCSVVSHNRHSVIDTQKAAQAQKTKMAEALEKAKVETVLYKNEIMRQTELMDKNKNEILSAENKVTDAVEECIRNLREHGRVMKAKLAEIYEAQQRNHKARLENFEMFLSQLRNCVEKGESILQRNISVEILQTCQVVVGRCEELVNAAVPDIYKAPHVRYILENEPNILDRIVCTATDPLMSIADKLSQKEVTEKTETYFIIVTRNSDGQQCYHKDDQIKVDISTPAGDQLETELTDAKDGKYTVTYTPQCVGQHRVEIQVNGEPLIGSPWVVQVIPYQYQFAFQFGSKGKKQGQFNTPVSIALSDNSRMLAVADRENKRIQMFSLDGNFLREIALGKKPLSLTFTQSGDLLVCCPGYDSKLSLFSETGRFVRNISCKHVKIPWWISVMSVNLIVACDSGDNKIKVLTDDFQDLLQSFGAPECDVAPGCVVYHQEKFFVSYPNTHRVMVFNIVGEYLYDIGRNGLADTLVTRPNGLAIDQFDRLIVCDSGNNRLLLFTLDGKYVANVTGVIFKDSELRFAVMSDTGLLFITDFDKNNIYAFH